MAGTDQNDYIWQAHIFSRKWRSGGIFTVKKAIECVDCQTTLSVESLKDRIIVGEKVAHIPGLERMVEDVLRLRLDSIHAVGDELMRRVKATYQVPPDEEQAYRRALLDYYDSRVTSFI